MTSSRMDTNVIEAMFRGTVYHFSLLQHVCPNLNSICLDVGSLLYVLLPNVTSSVERTDEVPNIPQGPT